jgi:hypothetical protein
VDGVFEVSLSQLLTVHSFVGGLVLDVHLVARHCARIDSELAVGRLPPFGWQLSVFKGMLLPSCLHQVAGSLLFQCAGKQHLATQRVLLSKKLDREVAPKLSLQCSMVLLTSGVFTGIYLQQGATIGLPFVVASPRWSLFVSHMALLQAGLLFRKWGCYHHGRLC